MKILRKIVKAAKWIAVNFAEVIFIAIALILLIPSKIFDECIVILRKLSKAQLEIERS